MAFCVFDGGPEVVYLWLQNKSLRRDFKMIDLVVGLGVEDTVAVGREVLRKADVVAIGPEAFAIIGLDYDFATIHRGEDFRV